MTAALERWALALRDAEPRLRAVGYIGSYARNDWGPGSDVDVILVLDSIAEPFPERGRHITTSGLPVPADLLIYSTAEFVALRDGGAMMGRVLRDELRWVWTREAVPG